MNLAPEYASFGRRLLATLIDVFIITLFAAIVMQLIFQQPLLSIVSGPGGLQLEQRHQSADTIIGLIVTIVMWVKFGGTPGKLLLGCQVVDARTGGRLGWGQAVIRYFAYLVSIIPLFLGFFWIIWDKKNQAFHDKIARTVVVVNQGREMDKNDESQKTLEQLVKESE